MSNFVKLFGSILDSSVWQEDPATRLTWITMLAMADQYGVVEASVIGLAARARVDLKDCQFAIDAFLAPDQYSRTPDHEGRRIGKVEGGWRILNHAKYRDKMSHEDRKEYHRKYYREKRSPKAQKSSTNPQQNSNNSTHTEAEAEAEANTKAIKKDIYPPKLNSVIKDFLKDNYKNNEQAKRDDAEYFFNYCEATGWMISGSRITNWRASAKAWRLKGIKDGL